MLGDFRGQAEVQVGEIVPRLEQLDQTSPVLTASVRAAVPRLNLTLVCQLFASEVWQQGAEWKDCDTFLCVHRLCGKVDSCYVLSSCGGDKS